MASIFLSYAREDLDAAHEFAAVLERGGHKVWWDHHLRAGSRFSWEIDAALKSAEAVVVLWSKSSVDSAWVQDEAAEGLEGSRLVPVALDGTKPPLGFRQYHTIDLTSWRAGGTATHQLVSAIDARVGGTSIGSPPPRRETKPQPPSICVLPFANKSGEADQAYFGEGITEDVITDLCKVSALSVIRHSCSAALNPQHVDLKQLATDLGATYVVEGTVRKSDTRLRITAHLVEIATGRSLWAERYDRELRDIFEIQDEISLAIVEALQLTLLPQEKTALDRRDTSSAAAYDLYLRARALWSAGSGDYRKNEAICRLCAEAAGLDSHYAGAWALIALASAELHFWQRATVDALMPAEKAGALDERLTAPHCVRARHFEEQGLDEDADAAVEIALGLDPESWEANREAGQVKFRRGNVVEAIPYFEKAAAIMKTDHDSASTLICCCNAVGDTEGVLRAAQTAVARAEQLIICDPINGSAFASAARGFAALGEGDRALKWTRKALNVDPGNLAMRYSLAATSAAWLGDGERALEILEPFAEAVRFTPHLRLLELDPSWAAIRDGASFQALLQRARKRL
ncbi:MAG: TIR domain-containing protein [Sphingomicrobium sp.]